MKVPKKKSFYIELFLSFTIFSGCQTSKMTLGIKPEEPQNQPDKGFLSQYAHTYRFRLGHPSSISITPGNDAVLYLRSGPRDFVKNLYSLDLKTGEESLLVSATQILNGDKEQISAQELARRERMRTGATRGIAEYMLSEDGTRILVPLSAKLYLIDRRTRNVRTVAHPPGYPMAASLSPDGNRVAYVQNRNLYITEIQSGVVRQLTHAENNDISYGSAEFVAQEEMDRYSGTWWSPDSLHIVVQQTDTSQVEKMHILDPMQPQKAPRSWAYPRAGRANARVRLGIVSAQGGNITWIGWNHDDYPYLAKVTWKNKAPLSILVQNRTQTKQLLLAVEPDSGRTRTLLTEHDPAWINLHPNNPYWLQDGQGFAWISDQGGHRNIQLRDRTGKLQQTLKTKDYSIFKLLSVDQPRRTAFVLAGRDATEQQVLRLSLSGRHEAPKAVSDEIMQHDAIFSKNHDIYIYNLETFAGNQAWVVKNNLDETLFTIQSMAEHPPFAPNYEIRSVGKLQYKAAIVRPRDFRPDRLYPVIVYVYAGPGAQLVKASGHRYLLQQWMADCGFIVVTIDGRGTPGRGIGWEKAIKGNFIKIPLNDQVEGLQALGRLYPEMDLGRVGVFGWSFGGYFSAMAVMQKPEIFHAAVAGAPVSDWMDYDTHYTERYLGLPEENPEGYHQSSVLSHASNLKRPLLLVHGTADDNVYFNHSVKLSNALFRVGNHHEFLPLSGLTHSVPDPGVTIRLYARIMEFFRRHLQS